MNKINQNFDHSNCKKIMNHHKRENACLRFFGVNMRDASIQGNHDSCHKTVIITVGGLALNQASAFTDRQTCRRQTECRIYSFY